MKAESLRSGPDKDFIVDRWRVLRQCTRTSNTNVDELLKLSEDSWEAGNFMIAIRAASLAESSEMLSEIAATYLRAGFVNDAMHIYDLAGIEPDPADLYNRSHQCECEEELGKINNACPFSCPNPPQTKV